MSEHVNTHQDSMGSQYLREIQPSGTGMGPSPGICVISARWGVKRLVEKEDSELRNSPYFLDLVWDN